MTRLKPNEKKLVNVVGKGKKRRVLGVKPTQDANFRGEMDIVTKVEVIQAPILLGTRAISEE